jgi:GNAT superfamily N-acetyltransferase
METKEILPKIEKAQLEDLEAILQLQYICYQSEAAIHNDYTIQPLTQTLDELLAEYHKGVILKAVKDGEIVGSVRAYADSDTVYIGKLMVHPDHQGKGLGQRLLAAIEGELQRQRFELFTSLKSDRNLHIYEKSGFKRFCAKTDDAGITFIFFEK